MRTKVHSDEGKAVYRQRKMIVEPVWGEINQVQGFRHFHRRGEAKVSDEFLLVAIGHHLRKLHAMTHPKPDTRYRRDRSARKQYKAA